MLSIDRHRSGPFGLTSCSHHRHYSFSSHHHDTDSDDQLSSSDTNLSSMPGNVNADTNDSQDNTESIDGLADGGLASFVKRSSIHDDFCTCSHPVRTRPLHFHARLDHSNKVNKIKREHSSTDAKTSSASKSRQVSFANTYFVSRKIQGIDRGEKINRKKHFPAIDTRRSLVPFFSISRRNQQKN